MKPTAGDLKKYNREWHVIITNDKLAELFEEYLKFDFREAQPFQAEAGERAFAPQYDLLVPRDITPPRQLRTFRPKTFTKKVTVQALLTPDNYAPMVRGIYRIGENQYCISKTSISISGRKKNARKNLMPFARP